MEGVITRFRQQINENSKALGWGFHVFPEMNHNELVGWAGGKMNKVIIFRSSFEHLDLVLNKYFKRYI